MLELWWWGSVANVLIWFRSVWLHWYWQQEKSSFYRREFYHIYGKITSLLQKKFHKFHNDLFAFRIHVRRTDKVGAEAAFHGIEEYMSYVEDYYKTLEKRQRVDERRVYIATDDPSVIDDAKRKYVCSSQLVV